MTWPQHSRYDPQQRYQHQPQQADSGGQTAIAITTQTAIAITTKRTWWPSVPKPKIFLNGHEVARAWGRSVVPVQPGHHHVHVHSEGFLGFCTGSAYLPVPVHPGQTVELEYRAPVWALSAGSLGPPPQRHKGVGMTIGFMVGSLALPLLIYLLGRLG